MIKILLLLAISLFALNDATVPYTFTTGEKILASQFNSNFDTIETWIAKTNDSIDDKFIRFSDLNGGDSTLRVDTVYGGSSVWTGISIIDSLVVTKQIQGNIKGNVVGNVTGNVTGNITGDITGNVTGNISGATGTFTGTVIVDSLKSTKQIQANLKGNVTGNVTGNLTGNVTGNASGTAATVTGAAQTAITSVGTLTGLTVSGTTTADSVYARTLRMSTYGNILSGGNANNLTLYDQTLVAGVVFSNYYGNASDADDYGSYSFRSGRRDGEKSLLHINGKNGRVGIDTTIPREKLHVNRGNIRCDTLKGAVIGNVTGNVSGTAATVTTAAQSAITSVGTLTGLTMGGNITTSTNDIITDSVFARTLTTSGNVNTGSGDITTDSVYARTIKASGIVQADTLKGNYSFPSMVLTGKSRTFIQTIRDTTIATDATINLFSAATLASYAGEIEITIGTLRHVKKTFSWYGQNGVAGVDSLTLYDMNPAADGFTINLKSTAASPSTLGVEFTGVGASRSVAMHLKYTKTN